MDAVKFFKEKERMCDSFNSYCDGCEIERQRCGIGCGVYIKKYPEKAVAIVEKWSAEHPQETRFTYFLKCFPNAMLLEDGVPLRVCPHVLGIGKDKCNSMRNCKECWNTPLEEE